MYSRSYCPARRSGSSRDDKRTQTSRQNKRQSSSSQTCGDFLQSCGQEKRYSNRHPKEDSKVVKHKSGCCCEEADTGRRARQHQALQRYRYVWTVGLLPISGNCIVLLKNNKYSSRSGATIQSLELWTLKSLPHPICGFNEETCGSCTQPVLTDECLSHFSYYVRIASVLSSRRDNISER